MRYLLLIILFSQLSFAQSFEKGNELYRKEKYQEAITEYERVLRTKKHSAELYYNIGSAYYKLNKVAPAVYNFEEALLLDPADKDIQNNLRFAHKMMIDEVREVPKTGFGRLISDFTSTFHYDTWAWLSVLSAFLTLAFFAGYYFSVISLNKRIFFIGMFVWIFAMALSIFAAAHEKDRYQTERPAIVFEGIVSVKSEPKPNAPDVLVIHEGTKVYVLEKLDSWRKVMLPDGNDGWLPAETIKEIK